MNVLDLFSGIGGFSLGLERAGMRTVAFCEIDPYCRAVLAKHWPDVPVFGDVRELTWADRNTDDQDEHGRALHDETGRGLPKPSSIDVICGGFPCQDISVAGKGAGITGERSGLWSEYARIIGEVKPRWVIIENVSALLSGGDEYELPNDRCLCGWPYRWRGLHQHLSTQQGTDFLRPDRCGDGAEGLARFGAAAGEVRRQYQHDATTNGEMGGGAGVAIVRSSTGTIPDGNLAAPDFEARTSGTGIAATADDQLSAEEAEWFRFLDGGGEEERQGDAGTDAGIEPQGTAAQSISRMVCEACGRDVDHAATRSGVATWMGRILRDLAQIGYSSEFHCIPASAVGAPHRRDRIWIVAYSNKSGLQGRLPSSQQECTDQWTAREGGSLANPSSTSTDGHTWRTETPYPVFGVYCHNKLQQSRDSWWLVEPDVGRVVNGVPARVHRLRALGNAVVPQIVELIGRAILDAERAYQNEVDPQGWQEGSRPSLAHGTEIGPQSMRTAWRKSSRRSRKSSGEQSLMAERESYDGQDDMAKSLLEGYRVIRERMAQGGPGWTPK